MQHGKFSANFVCVALPGRLLRFWPWNTSTSLTDNNALGLRREISQLRAQLATCSAAASAITGCKHPSSSSLCVPMTVCEKKNVEPRVNPLPSLSYPATWQDVSALRHAWHWLFSGLVHLNKARHAAPSALSHILFDACWSNVGFFVQF